jgi:hypothetical protein
MLQLIIHAPSSIIGNAHKAIQINQDTTVGGLRKYLESVLMIPKEKQMIKQKNSSRFLLEQHNGLKCIDIGLLNDCEIDIMGPIIPIQDTYSIASFFLQFSTMDQPISLMPRCAIIWVFKDCPEHIEDCNICNKTGKIAVPLYCPFTPIISSIALAQDILATIDIQGHIENIYDTTRRRHYYQPAVSPTDNENEKNVRIICSDFGQHGTNGVEYVTCQTRLEDSTLTEPQKTTFRFSIDSPQQTICRICFGPLFHGDDVLAPVAWAWACTGCHCVLHPKCAIEQFQETGEVKCRCIACISNVNANANPNGAVAGNVNNQLQEAFRMLFDVENIMSNVRDQPNVNVNVNVNEEFAEIGQQTNANGEDDGGVIFDANLPPLEEVSSSENDYPDDGTMHDINDLRLPGDLSSEEEYPPYFPWGN